MELTPPLTLGRSSFSRKDLEDDPTRYWTYPKGWDTPRADGLVTMNKMKRRFIKEIIASWDQTDSDRGPDQWLDQIDCRGCKFSFKRLLQHLELSSKCQPFYSESEIEILHQQKFDRIESKKQSERDEKSYRKSMKHYKPNDVEKMRKTEEKYGIKLDFQFNEDEVPKYLLPFAPKKAKPDLSMKQPIEVMTVKDDSEKV